MQNLCRQTIEHISYKIKPGMSLIEVREECETFMLENGADSFWYYGVGAFIFSGNKTAISISGSEYVTDNSVIGENDIITIDLSPQRNRIWGDYARTLIIEDGELVRKNIKNSQWKAGIETEDLLHSLMIDFVNYDTSFEDLYYYINEIILNKGFINLDFLGNLGHSIEDDKCKRIYIEKGNRTKLSDVIAFTFEPHIGLSASMYGYKKENIYSFVNGNLIEL